ncbi:MAG TPA: polyhydroxyalkanoic acid system family protein [Vicinamibacterales bacterium]|jgi:hypothetical protein
MRIEQGHQLSLDEAMGRVDQFLDGLAQQTLPGGLTIKDPLKVWEGNRMTFSFTAAKDAFGLTIRGAVEVTDQHALVETDLPALVKTFIGEDRIKDLVSRELGKVLA